jgi:hypothetical protein
MVAPSTREACRSSSGALHVLSNPHASSAGGERVAVGYIRLAVSRNTSKSARGQTLQPAVVLRQFWRHPSWPDPDQNFIWPHPSHGLAPSTPARTTAAAAAAATAGPRALPHGAKQPQPPEAAAVTSDKIASRSSSSRRQSAPTSGGRRVSSGGSSGAPALTGPRGQPGPPSQNTSARRSSVSTTQPGKWEDFEAPRLKLPPRPPQQQPLSTITVHL